MRNEFTAVIERDEDWFIAYCPEIPGANGQGKSKEECLESLRAAIELILEDRREDGLSRRTRGRSAGDPRDRSLITARADADR
ncbi:MAG TPA: type II toxin-antitoxin system HicB family antitoxin [Longimicrobium sp.]|nr:type II toxin-antitoxin system HicB family antitoxin [Longimicrobium sp.]